MDLYKQSREVLFTASTMLLDINELIAPIREEQERLVQVKDAELFTLFKE